MLYKLRHSSCTLAKTFTQKTMFSKSNISKIILWFLFFSPNQRLISIHRHKDNSSKCQYIKYIKNKNWDEHTYIYISLYVTKKRWHFLGPCPSSMPSIRNCSSPLAQGGRRTPQSLYKTFTFVLQVYLLAFIFSVFFPSSSLLFSNLWVWGSLLFSCPPCIASILHYLPPWEHPPCSTFTHSFVATLVLLCAFLPARPLCCTHTFSI